MSDTSVTINIDIQGIDTIFIFKYNLFHILKISNHYLRHVLFDHKSMNRLFLNHPQG